MKKSIFVMAVLICLMISISGFTAKIVSTTGKVSIQRDGDFKRAKKGMKLKEGDIIVTGSRSALLIRLKDNSTIEVHALSILKLDLLQGLASRPGQSKKRKKYRVKLKLKIGGIRANVPVVKGLKKKFQVQTPKGTASVRGTEKLVRYSQDRGIQLTVTRGIVLLETNLGSGKSVRKGERSESNEVNTRSRSNEKSRGNRKVLLTNAQTEGEKDRVVLDVNLPDSPAFDVFNSSNVTIVTDCGCQ